MRGAISIVGRRAGSGGIRIRIVRGLIHERWGEVFIRELERKGEDLD